jgi:hypothetical protein
MRTRFKWRLAILVYCVIFGSASALEYGRLHVAAGMVLLVLLALAFRDETILRHQTNDARR